MSWLGLLKGFSRFSRRHSGVFTCFSLLGIILIFLHSKADWSVRKELDDPTPEQQRHVLDDTLVQLQRDLARVEAELKNERLKSEMLNRDLIDVRKTPVTQLTTEDHFKHEQRGRQIQIKRVCAEKRPLGLVNTLMTSKKALTYCVIPRFVNTFWLQVFRYINKDYIGDIQSPLDIGYKEAHDRPFIRTKKIGWSRATADTRKALLDTEIFLVAQNPYRRLWESYVENFMLPQKWSTVGFKIAIKRKSKSAVHKPRELTPSCGLDVTFEEFVLYSLGTYEAEYEPIYRQCDPCQLKPTYIIKDESLMTDTQSVLERIDMAWVVQNPNFTDDTQLRFINRTILENFDKLQEASKQACALPGKLGLRLYDVFKNFGIIPDGTPSPKIDSGTTANGMINKITKLYFDMSGRGLDREAQIRNRMVKDYKTLNQDSWLGIKNKYAMDFKLFGYDETLQELN